MKDALAYAFVGLGTGGLISLLAIGLVIAYKGTGVINFAHGAVAMYTSFQFYYLRNTGIFHFPWADFLPTSTLNVPVKISLNNGNPINFWIAGVLALLTSMLLGASLHYLIFKPLRNAAPLGKVIGAVGALIYLQGIGMLYFGSEQPQPAPVFLPDVLVFNFLGLGLPIPAENIALAGAAVVIGAGVWAIYRFTRIGLATRAAAGNEKGAVLLGYSPNRLALYNWMLAAIIAGLAGILAGSVIGSLQVGKLTLLIVPALGAALIGSLSSIPLAVAGGIAIGLLQAMTGSWLTSQTFFPAVLAPGAEDVIPFAIIVVFLFLKGKSLPVRGALEEKRLPLSPYPKRVGWYVMVFVPLGAIIAFGLPGDFLFAGLSARWGFAFSTSILTAILMLSFVVLSGYLGQISLVQLSFSGVAAFIMARLMSTGVQSIDDPFAVSGFGMHWLPASILGVFVAIIVGVIIGIPALRIRGVQLGVVTIAASVTIQNLFFNNENLTGLMGGVNYTVKSPSLFGVNFGSGSESGLIDNPRFTLFALLVLAGLCTLVANIRRGSTGRRFLAVRANERAAASAGIDVARTKLLGFALSSAIAGIAGVMFAFQQQAIGPQNWEYFVGLGALAFAYLGGIASINGAIIGGMLTGGGLIATFGAHHSEGSYRYSAIFGGIGMILTAITHPSGQATLYQPMLQAFGTWLKIARGKEWLAVGKRLGPFIVLGAAWGAIGINPWRTDTWDRSWMILLEILITLFVRSIVNQIRHARSARIVSASPIPQEASV